MPSAANALARHDPLLHGEPLPVDRRAGQRARPDVRVPRVIAAGRRQARDAARGGHARDDPRGAWRAPPGSRPVAGRRSARSAGAPRAPARDRREPEVDLLQAMEAGEQDRRRRRAASARAPPAPRPARRAAGPARGHRSRTATAGAATGPAPRRRGAAPAACRTPRRSRRSRRARTGSTVGSRPTSSSRGSAWRPRPCRTRMPAAARPRPTSAAETGEHEVLDRGAGAPVGSGPSPASRAPRTRAPGRSPAPARGWRRSRRR